MGAIRASSLPPHHALSTAWQRYGGGAVCLRLRRSDEIISNDGIKKISFAAGGEKADYDFVTYVAKDKRDNRYCHVFDCGIMADDVLATIGQIFSILTHKADDDLAADREALAEKAETLDNPLYHAVASGGAVREGVTAVNVAYDDGGGGAADAQPVYETADGAGQDFAKFLNEQVPSQAMYGEIADDAAVYGDTEPGWGYLDVKPDEDLYGGLADVFVDE